VDPTLRALLWSWEWRPSVILVLSSLGVTYGLGWWRLRRRGYRRLANGRHIAAYWSGLAVLALALLSAIDLWQPLLFSIHMVQHLLLMMVAAPFLWLANPLPFFLWGLPTSFRRAVGRMLARPASFRQGLRRLTTPWVAWVLFTVNLWLWHAPAAYDAALANGLIHNLEHLTFFSTSILFWWHVTGAAPRIHGSLGYGLRIVYLLTAMIPGQILSVAITFASQPLYSHYVNVPRLWGLSVMEDQVLAGTIMWIPGGMIYMLAALTLLARLLNQEERKATQGNKSHVGSREQRIA
jgi:putative membrane protein